jgi:hypothetical protein
MGGCFFGKGITGKKQGVYCGRVFPRGDSEQSCPVIDWRLVRLMACSEEEERGRPYPGRGRSN